MHTITTTEPDPIDRPGVLEQACACGERVEGLWLAAAAWADGHQQGVAFDEALAELVAPDGAEQPAASESTPVPAPTLPCPFWSVLPPRHGWDSADETAGPGDPHARRVDRPRRGRGRRTHRRAGPDQRRGDGQRADAAGRRRRRHLGSGPRGRVAAAVQVAVDLLQQEQR